ncbi:MAG TPA: nucleotide sugar dehydrogenase [Roseiflexaceae bacterium]|nr:nucleotide sugar dehydrogenase [Roseiflexaceae bacterium]
MSGSTYRSQLLARIASREARVGIVGVGYVGLPLAVVFAEAGFRVTGFDLSAERVAQINAGRSYIADIPGATIARLRAEGRIEASADFARLAEMDAISICVPTPLRKTRDPDISAIVRATEDIAQRLRPGQVIVLESTTYPGTTREVILPQLEASGLQVGRDYFLAFSPERVDPGRTDWTTANTPKVMGGLTPACLEVARAFYEQAIARVVPVSSPEAAEMVKLLENTFRAVNIGLVNEVLLMCDKLGLDVWEVIDAAGTKPFGFMKFTPGPGLGGHCIPIDPLYLSWKLKTLNYTARFIELASEVNTAMPHYWAQRVQDALNDAGKALRGSTVLVVGVAYKKDVDDVRESPALDIMHLLIAKGAEVSFHDPHVARVTVQGRELACAPDLAAALQSADCVVIVTDHSAYDWSQIHGQARLLVDTRATHRLLNAKR